MGIIALLVLIGMGYWVVKIPYAIVKVLFCITLIFIYKVIDLPQLRSK
jgi:C4-dicarboxylate transporter